MFTKNRDTDLISINLENKREFTKFIDGTHPCVMAQSVVRLDHIDCHTYSQLGSKKAAQEIITDVEKYLSQYDFDSKDFYSFIAFFSDIESYSEKQFEKLLWKQLQYIHDLDQADWDSTVSQHPEDSNFSFSIGGKAFFIIGMHPNSSRIARQSPKNTIVFNLHCQFEKLREKGIFHKVRDKIRKRDAQLHGNVNPMVKDYGTQSEALQYSGRKLGSDWHCPFENKNNKQ